mgnify:FL=1|tara:strand:- start:1032 stop:1760 length:729 start_codon:yes stop_codon:yes gene_type:complete
MAAADKKINLPEILTDVGSLHPITKMQSKISKMLQSLGFVEAHGPEIETEEYNFDMLNIKSTHPARQMHDTFYVENMSRVLRTHTSPVQIRSMLEIDPPIAIFSSGRVYRKDDDATHLPMFNQIEGIMIDRNVSFRDLKSLIYKIIHDLFGSDVKLRFRPSYFPFTEPSAEVDILFGESDKWLEILGCGLVNPIVLENCNINSEIYSGLAFGLGVERISMLDSNVPDIRDFYKSNLDFLKQF